VRILSRYFLASYLYLFVAILIGSVVAIMVVEMLLNFDEIVDKDDGFRSLLTYLFLRIPTEYLRDMIPVTSFAAAFFCLGLPARWREITAIKAGGIAPQRVAAPVLCAALLLSGLALIVNETAVLQATRAWNHRENAGATISFRRGSFWYHRGNTIYNVQEADRETKTLYGVSVYKLSPEGRLLQSIVAQQVEVAEDRRWRFVGALVRKFDPSAIDGAPGIERLDEAVLDVADERDLALLAASAGTLSLPDLREYIEARARQGRSATRHREMFHARLADPLSVLLFALIAVPLGLAVERTRSLAVSALYGIAIIAVFYTIRTAASLFAASGFAFAVLSPWITLSLFGSFGAWRYLRAPR
jgi:LPS export ABC transporter permease LptG